MEKMPIPPQRRFALEVVRTLRDAGHEALWAGGCVRDALLGKTPKDFDVATAALPDTVRELFGQRRTLSIGASFGVITVLAPKGSVADPIEVATFRTDGAYQDGRRPESVHFTGAKEDAMRRDFTINGMFYDPIAEKVIDYVDGQTDLQAGVVRAIGRAEDRFAEDRLRMLRAVRFASTLSFEIDPETAHAVRAHAPAIQDVSPERIGHELRRMLVDAERGRAVRLLSETELLGAVLPPLAAIPSSQLEVALSRLARLEGPTAALALATLLLEVGGARASAQMARALKWTSKEAERTAWLVEHATALEQAESRPWSEVQPLLAAEGGQELVALRHVVHSDEDSTDTFCRAKLALPAEVLDPAPLVVGADLIAAGLRPGPHFRELLAKARAAQLDGEVDHPAAALRWLNIPKTP